MDFGDRIKTSTYVFTYVTWQNSVVAKFKKLYGSRNVEKKTHTGIVRTRFWSFQDKNLETWRIASVQKFRVVDYFKTRGFIHIPTMIPLMPTNNVFNTHALSLKLLTFTSNCTKHQLWTCFVQLELADYGFNEIKMTGIDNRP